MGLFLLPIGKRFLRAQKSAPWGPIRASACRVGRTGCRESPGWGHAKSRIFIRHHKM